MYESYYGLNKKPFQITTDPSFLWMGTKHRQALNTLKYGVMDNKGFILLTGDVGTGKTTVINRLMEDIKDKVYTAKIPDPRLTKYDFYRMVSRYFKLPIEVRTKSDFIDPFSRFLSDAQHEKKSVLLLIDEAQRLKHDLMEEIRLLSNLENQDAKLLNIFFVGQNEFNATLLQPENRALMRRITMTYNIDPLSHDETGEYIRHRLKVAGANYEIFSAGAVEAVYDFSNGFPRQINIICDLAMFFASQLNQRSISHKVVRQCRERISFNITDEPVTPRKRIVAAPASRSPTDQALQSSRPPQAHHLWMGIVAALLLVGGVGIYFTTPEWKARARQWIHQIGQPDGQPSDVSAAAIQTDSDAAADPRHAAAESSGPVVAGSRAPSARLPDMPLRMPPPPPDFEPRGTIQSATRPAMQREGDPSTALPSADAATAVSPQPDPAEAVEWVLNHRQREKRP